MEILIAVVVVVAIIMFFALGILVGVQVHAALPKDEPKPKTEVPELSEQEIEQMKRERQELIAQQKAFTELMGYNANTAYAIETPLDER